MLCYLHTRICSGSRGFLYQIIFVFFICFFFILGCSKHSVARNPYLPEYRFSYTINIDLPAYNALKYPQNTIYLPNIGIKGVFITNTGSGRYVAWEAACPNRPPSECERLKCASKQGEVFVFCENDTKAYIFVKCPCDDTVYNLINGSVLMTSNQQETYPLLNYAVSVAGTRITISN